MEVKKPQFRTTFVFSTMAISIGLFVFFFLNYQNSQRLKETAKNELLSQLELYDCYTTDRDIRRERDTSVYSVGFQCFKENKQVSLLLSKNDLEVIHDRFNLSNENIEVSDRKERILLSTAPDIYKKECSEGQVMKYCNLLKTKPSLVHRNI